MNSRLLRYAAALLVGVFLLQFYFIREIVVIEIFFALLHIAALVVALAAFLIGYAALLWLERPPQIQRNPQIAWKERSIEQ